MLDSKKIRKKLKDLYPELRRVVLRNQFFRDVDEDELGDIVGLLTPITGSGECEDFTTIFHGEVRQYRMDKGYDMPYPIGECLVNLYQGMNIFHALNIAITGEHSFPEDIWLIDPETGDMWVADKDNDNIYYVWI